MNRKLETSVISSENIGRLARCAGRAALIRLLLLCAILNLPFAVPANAGKTSGGKPTAPAAPSNLTATAVSSSQINLSWQDNSSNESGFNIMRGPSATGPWSQIGTAAAGAT